MAQDTNGAQGTGQEGSQAADAQQQSTDAQAGQPAAGGEGGTPAPPKQPGDTVITAATLQGVVSRLNRSTEENIKKAVDGLTQTFVAKLDELTKAAPHSKGAGGQGNSADPAATAIDLERQVKELRQRLEQSEQARATAEKSEKEYKFRTQVESALARNGCKRTAYGFEAIRPHLVDKGPEEGIVAKVKDTVYGEVEIPLDKFIKDHFAEEIFPEIFPSKVRAGAPAGGDSGNGSGNGKYLYKESDIAKITSDPDRYQKERDKIDDARRTGRIQLGV